MPSNSKKRKLLQMAPLSDRLDNNFDNNLSDRLSLPARSFNHLVKLNNVLQS